MPSLKDIRKKIQGVRSTQQITKAMKLMATVKLRRAMEAHLSTHLYLEKLEQMVVDLRSIIPEGIKHPLMGIDRPIKSRGIVLVTGERGLCGSFNHDLIKTCLKLLQEKSDCENKLILIGRKGCDYFRRQNYQIIASHPDLIGKYSQKTLVAAARNAINLYSTGIIDELVIIYSHFVSAIERHIKTQILLPISEIGIGRAARLHSYTGVQFDPSPEAILTALIPRYVEGLFMKAVLESSASEQAARMLAMDAATDRAQEMIDDLTMKFNRTRQAVITKEITEVIAGADALAE